MGKATSSANSAARSALRWVQRHHLSASISSRIFIEPISAVIADRPTGDQ